MRAFYEVFGVAIAIFACLLMLLTTGLAMSENIGLSRWIIAIALEITLLALGVQLYESSTE